MKKTQSSWALMLCLALMLLLAACKSAAGPVGAVHSTSALGPALTSAPQTEPGTGQGGANSASQTEPANGESSSQGGDATLNPITITINGTEFLAALQNSEAAHAFAQRLPLTLEMEELHGNEKFYYLAQNLPTDPVAPGQIQAGDLMLFGSDCLVLFYESFSTNYRYTKIGRVQNPEALAQVVGAGSVSVAFSME